MQGYVPGFSLERATTLGEAFQAMEDRDAQPFAGGTDIMVVLEAGHMKPGNFVDITCLSELKGLSVTDKELTIGSLVSYSEIQDSPLVQQHCPSLILAGAETGGVAIQNRGTLGGNIANASPAADSPPVLLAADAELTLVSKSGERRRPLEGFFQGYKKMDLQPNELLKAVHIPIRDGWSYFYRKVGTRRAQAISKVVFCGSIKRTGDQVVDVRLAYGSVGPVTLRARRTEDTLRGHRLDDQLVELAAAELVQELVPIDDIRSEAGYRLEVSENLLKQFLREQISS